MRRLGEVLALLEPIRFDWGFFGSKDTPDWLRHVVTLWLGHDRKGQPFETLLALASDGGLGLEAVLEIPFSRDASRYGSDNCLERFAGVDAWLRDDAAGIIAAAARANAGTRSELAAAIGRLNLHDRYFPLLLDLASGTAKGPRKAANQALTGADKAALAPVLEQRFEGETPARRALLVETMAHALGEDAAAMFARLRTTEKSAPVLAAMDRYAGAVATAPQAKARGPWHQDGKAGYQALDGEWVAAPERADLPPQGAIENAAYDLLLPVIEAYNRKVQEERQKFAGLKHHWAHRSQPVTAGAIKKLRDLAEMSYPVSPSHNTFPWLHGYLARHANIDLFFDHPSVNLRHLTRMAIGMGVRAFGQLLGAWAGPAGLAVQRRLGRGADMRVLYDLWLENGGQPFMADYLASAYYGEVNQFGTEAWPFFLEHLPELDEALGLVPQSGNRQFSTYRALRLLELFPKVPERYRARLMILANESTWQTRQKARDLLQGAAGIEDAIALQLDDGKQNVRASAADWLVARDAKSHIPAIRKRLKAERSDIARAAMITALERLGDDTSDFFNRKAMLSEAEKGLKKAMPKGLDWFPFDALPGLTWASGEPVDPSLPRYWVVLATRLKDPAGNALIDLWLDRLAPGDAHRLGWMVLTGWIAEDTRMPTEEEANAYALANVDAVLTANRANRQRWPQSADYFSIDRDTVFAQLKRQKASVYLGTATDSKGILALASRVEGADAAPRIRSFLKDHGSRTSQARALLDVLASIGTPPTLQVLLSTADRLKQKSVQAHAAKLIEEIAERRGWTAGELADRTVPTGGLDEDGVLALDCGQDRTYTARLDEEDRLVLLNPAGKEVKALPSPRVDEEGPAIAAAKKALSTAKKEVKQVVTAQTERFREAMCMERSWSGEDWTNYVAAHPILGRLAARLVWLGLDAEGSQVASFRPLGDGTCTDATDGEVDPAGFATVKLAHSTLLAPDALAAWQTHLADYAVTPLFDQLGRSLPEVTDAMRRQRSITDREGYMIETFRLRGIASKLGYQRGEVVDGGCFMTYVRSMREAGLVAEVEFTGSYLPEENIPAALISLSFRKLMPNGRPGGHVGFTEVPEVLLAESWRDLYDMAEKGTGFDPDWQKKAAL
ncbi:MAG: DUF4132 domain-containing protein [Erythrobacter sp.]|nr:DUF4132 domain-containing protein [Erythrobacter sp.]